MVSYKFHIDKRVKKTGNVYPLRVALAVNGKYYRLYSGVDVREEEWNDEYQKIIGNDNKQLIIDKIKSDMDSTIADLKSSSGHGRYSRKEIRKRISYIIKGDEENTSKLLFIDYLEKFAQSKKKENTRNVYFYTRDKICKFVGEDKVKDLTFEDITYKWLQEFDKFLSATSRTNSRSIHMRNIRAVFNEALKDEIITCYPFRKFHIQSEQTAKRSLTVEELVRLRDFPCEPYLEKYRDIFMLVFYLIGINMVDLCALTEINNRRIEYRRSKTGRLYSIKVEPEAEYLINKYRGGEHLLFVLDKYRNYKDFMLRMDAKLKRIGFMHRSGPGGKKTIEPLLPNISTYWARHTWATIAYEIGIPKGIILQALGHNIGVSYPFLVQDYLDSKVNNFIICFIHSSVFIRSEVSQ